MPTLFRAAIKRRRPAYIPENPISLRKTSTRPVSFDSFILSTPASPVPTYLPTTSTPPLPTTSRPSLSELHLDGFTWLESLLDASAENIVLYTNDTSAIVMKLSKDSVAPKEASDADCASAVEGGAGVCVYLSRCDAAKTITVDVFKTTYCTVNGGYAGVCCPQKKVDLTH